ncbi:MAG: GNAT family N-acetyltransferase [Acidimicrobiia bacterium]|nr:GNAT family N-acetyltransferase [Acidimicrobiia bacterium]
MSEQTLPGPEPDRPNDTPVLLTARLELSFGRREDADVLFPFVHGDDGRVVTDTLLWDGPERPDDIWEFLRMHATATFEPDGFNWVIRDRSGALTGEAGRAIGSIGIRPTGRRGEADIGYWIAPPYWNQGLMTEAVTALVRHAFEHWKCTLVSADAFTVNVASQRLLEKVGFRKVADQPGYLTKRGEPVDGYRYEILPGDSP